jgi:capsular polysaccharide biosynthesis protein
MDEALDSERITNVNQAQAATLAEKPISPSKVIVGAMTLLLASAGTVALVLGCEKLDSRVRTEEQVELLLQLPVLAAIPEGRRFGAIPARMH